jgi:hypothetical protein
MTLDLKTGKVIRSKNKGSSSNINERLVFLKQKESQVFSLPQAID